MRDKPRAHLFRQEALDHQQERQWGQCIGFANPAGTGLTMLLLMLVVVACSLLLGGDYNRKATVHGVLVADKGTVQVRAPADGVVEVMSVGLGSRVGKGDRMLSVRTAGSLGGKAVADKLLFESRRQAMLLQEQHLSQDRLTALQLGQLEVDLENYRSRQSRLESLLAGETEIRLLLWQQLERVKAMQQGGYVASADKDKLAMDLLKQDSRLLQLQLEVSENRRLLSTTLAEKNRAQLENRRRKNELDQAGAELAREAIRIRAARAVEVLSPVTGTVAVVYLLPGDSVTTRQSLLAVIPDDSTLQAELHVPSRAIGFLAERQPVNLRLDAFAHQKFGVTRGYIRSISSSVMVPGDIPGEAVAREPYYKVTANLERQDVNAYGQRRPLRPGMQFNADIRLESRSLFEWLLEPLFSRGRRG